MSDIKKVSETAGVSIATVSRTFSSPDIVSQKTRAKVQKAAKELGYHPNSLARNFRVQRSYSIIALVPDMTNPFFARVIGGLEKAANNRGYTLLLGNTGHNIEIEKKYANLAQTSLVDGIIQLSAHYPLECEPSLRKIPLVNICECFNEPNVPQVIFDNVGGARAIMKLLLEKQHRNIGIVTGPNESPLNEERIKGCEEALYEYGIKLDPDNMYTGDFTFEEGYRAADIFLKRETKPTAIFCFNDEMAIGSMKRIKEDGLRVPHDMSVAGFDDIHFAAYSDPPLTTVAQPAEAFGEPALNFLCDQIDRTRDNQNYNAPERKILPYELVIRDSVATCAKN